MDSSAAQILTTLPSYLPKGVLMHDRIRNLLKHVGPGKMSDVAYDTAWVARLGEIDLDLSQRSLAWLSENQLPDGSWGADQPIYYHDRLISTLAAMIALTYRGRRAQDRAQIERGLLALERIVDSSTLQLQNGHQAATVGFEMIAPTLVAEAERLGIVKQHGDKILQRIERQRVQKLSNLRGKMINRNVTLAFSSEMAGLDHQQMLDVDNLQEENGSVGCSPSASAYFILQVKIGNQNALEYLHKISGENGGAPNVAPFDTFETAWALWNFSMIPGYAGWKNESEILQHTDSLSRAWNEHQGAGFSSEYSVNDGDGSAIVFDTLSRYGITKETGNILSYEEKEWFRCFDLENETSLSANVHILGALRQAGFQRDHPSVNKILAFLQKTRSPEGYWRDKWHLSPYYTTSHAIIACAGYADEIVSESVNWMINTQKNDGSWGTFGSTREETAYALQALWQWSQKSQSLSKEYLHRGKVWLEDHRDADHSSLWVGKCLYKPVLVIDSAVETAITLIEG
jgi:halimadienyl-diphosphate synthase